MYGVKRESGEEICRGCFSTGRRLSPLTNYDLFFGLLDDDQKLEALKSPTMHLCWECNASLRRMKLFKAQVQQAHRLLQELVGEPVSELPTGGLSQLSSCYKKDYDFIIEDGLDGTEEQEQGILPAKEETKVQADILNDNLNSDGSNYFEDTEYLETNNLLDLLVETTENSLVETETVPRKKYKRKLKRVKTKSSLQTKIKRKKIETVPIRKGNRTGLRSSGEIIPPVYPKIENGNKNDKNKIEANNMIKRESKQPNRKRRLNRKVLSQIVKEKNENQTLDDRETTAKDLQNEVTNDDDDEAEANTDAELENLDDKNTKEKIEIEVDEIEHHSDDNHSDESDSENDNGDNDDPDFEEENVDDQNYNSNDVKIKRKGVSTRNRWLNCVCIRFDVTNQLDEYFTKVDLGPEEVKHILDNELSYESEEQPYSCKYCGFCFQMFKTLLVHKRTRHKQIAKCTNRVYLMYRCHICHKTVRKEHTEAHMKYLHRWRYYCKECNKDFWDKEEANSHFKESHKQRLSCSLCNHVSASSKGMAAHIRHRHTPVSCDICGRTLTGTDSLRHHKQLSHRIDNSLPEQRYCVSCDKQFLSLYSYQNHIRYSDIHRGKKEYSFKCTGCGRLMRDNRSLRAHYDRFHSDKTRFQCPHCDKYFARNNGLRSHIDLVHLKKKLPKDKLCSICGRGFSTVRTLTHHIRTHTGERPHACPHCPAAFAQPYPLRKHLATQHRDAPKDKEAPAAQDKEAPAAQNKEAPTTQNILAPTTQNKEAPAAQDKEAPTTQALGPTT